MEDYQSKYTGEEVEEMLDQIANGEIGGGITAETDPIFSASPAASITDAKKAEWDGKQDAIADLATIREGASKGATALQSVPSEYGTKAWVTEQARDIANDAVGDFEAVAVEPLAEDVSQLKGAIGNKVDKVTGKGLSAEDFTSALKIKLEGLTNYDDTEISAAVASLQTQLDTLVSGDTTTAIKTFNEVIAFLDGIADTEDLAGIIASIEQQIAGKMDNVTLAKVATSGSYNDLSNKPTIPSAVTESTVSGWGFTKNTGTYSKPSGGIPKTDLASAVQTSLGKADTALQSYTEKYTGTVTAVKINNTTKNPTNGVVDLGTVITAHQDISGKQDVISDLETIHSNSQWTDNLKLAIQPYEFESAKTIEIPSGLILDSDTAYALPTSGYIDVADDVLLTRRRVKTINGESIYGSGDITISGGGVSEEYVNNAIANAITKTLNTPI